ncbi:PhzF family phenazine biosynthesis protein [Flavobacterium circumlabens]|uniref:PhzF family phenazine biosynthesis protein n=1 Tax=Flavobacterium circumlabens TaxID=2133765 RepID=A0A4Y7UDQ5_9FLAO|nr:PhzF family phenazine biosynthesis protein [Flavobacterium circumlabens]TCN58938.1 PhzF family phenazine biosynthesis protein [Flavobacterium circumlabens]TEB44341.1 PhzF family phenazine biosynthesis protein [Flavobacterium circumlabens]
MKKALDYFVLDVFTDKSYKGNPLAVVFTKEELKLSDYENIAREFGYSETSFVEYSQQKQLLHVRSFTPIGFEVDGAGHNLLGAVCAALLKDATFFTNLNSVQQVMMKAVSIPIYINFKEENNLAVVKMLQKPALIGDSIPAEKIALALGLSVKDLNILNFDPVIVKTEVAHVMVPIQNIEILNTIKPDNKLLIALSKQYNFEGFYCFALTGEENGTIVQSRFFNPLIGIDEDAATGTAAGPLAGLLWYKKIIQKDSHYQILQGVKLNQPSLIEIAVTDDGILVGGSSVITMEGKIYIEN